MALLSSGIEDADIEAEVLLRHSLSVDRGKLYSSLGEDYAVGPEPLENLTERRLAGEPLFYIIGYREFYGLSLQVNRDVLIPRQETELLVEQTVALVQERYNGRAWIADVGTGSGAIAIALAVNLPDALVFATDVSREAIDLACLNVDRHDLKGRIRLLHGDMLGPLRSSVDVIVANLPYIPASEIPGLPPDVRREPLTALNGGREGLAHISRLINGSPRYLQPGGALLLEIDPRQTGHVLRLAAEAFSGAQMRVEKDLLGLDRVVAIDTAAARPASPP